ncbi:MAG: hypothetical protein PVJ28_00165 [Acidimicrobiia bacterium]|jgi:hypothetical protein
MGAALLTEVAMSNATLDRLKLMAALMPATAERAVPGVPTLYGVRIEIDDALPYGHIEPTYAEGLEPSELRRAADLIEGTTSMLTFDAGGE